MLFRSVSQSRYPQVYQELVDFYGQLFDMPPLSAKIYAYLAFDFKRKGLCFDDLVETLCTSKSSISSSINFLLNAELIKSLNKIDERKRYFLINEGLFINIRFEEIVTRMKREIKILDQLSEFRRTQVNNTEYEKRYSLYKSLLEKTKRAIAINSEKLIEVYDEHFKTK